MNTDYVLNSIPVSEGKSGSSALRTDASSATAPVRKGTEVAAAGQPLPDARAAKAVQEDKQPDAAEVDEAISNLNDYVQNLSRDLKFSVDEESGRMVVKVLDANTQDVIRQIPSEEALRLARSLHDGEGLLLSEQV